MSSFPSQPPIVHLDGYYDNPAGDFHIENEVLASAGLALSAPRENGWETAAGARVVLFRAERIDAEAIARLRCCTALIRYGIGLDKVDIPAASAAGIAVCNIPDFCTEEMADHTLALALALARRIPDYRELARGGDWRLSREYRVESFSDRLFATIGFGRIARQVLRRARAFGFRLAAADPMLPDEAISGEGITPLGIGEAIRTADILSLHCPLTASTAGLIGAESLASMKPGAILVNTARGGLVDSDALAAAVGGGRLGGAGLDVADPEPLPQGHPLYGLRNVIVTPHVAWYSEAAESKLKRLAAEEALRAYLNEPLRYQVNRPV